VEEGRAPLCTKLHPPPVSKQGCTLEDCVAEESKTYPHIFCRQHFLRRIWFQRRLRPLRSNYYIHSSPSGKSIPGRQWAVFRRRNDFTPSNRRIFVPTMFRANASLAGVPSRLFPETPLPLRFAFIIVETTAIGTAFVLLGTKAQKVATFEPGMSCFVTYETIRHL
jgi:hypothetical protein